MPKSTNQGRKERQAILNAMGLKMVIIPPPEYHKTECSICLRKIRKDEQKTLECHHVFHGECLKQWATRTTPSGEIDCNRPVKNRRINLFKKGENIFTCPCCRVEYTHDVYTHEIKKVLAKINVKNKGEDVVHYITHKFDTMAFVPFSEITNDNHIDGKWATILTLIQNAWERGDTDIYAMKRLEPEPEFVLTNDYQKTPPLNKITGVPKKEIKNGQLMVFRMVEVDELGGLLNDNRH
jgi:hypothetical protein